MSSNPQYRKRIARERRLLIREMMDGCNDCREMKGLCTKHYPIAVQMILHPRKFVNEKGQMELPK
jgi:hypothetical protein